MISSPSGVAKPGILMIPGPLRGGQTWDFRVFRRFLELFLYCLKHDFPVFDDF